MAAALIYRLHRSSAPTVPEFRSRSAVRVPPIAGESARPRCQEIKSVPYAPRSHPFVERLIGTIRRECLDCTLFWTAADFEVKLVESQRYFNGYRAHAGLNGRPPAPTPEEGGARPSLRSYRWQPHCRGLHHKPIAA